DHQHLPALLTAQSCSTSPISAIWKTRSAKTLDLKELQSVCWFAKKVTKNNSVSREAPHQRSFFFVMQPASLCRREMSNVLFSAQNRFCIHCPQECRIASFFKEQMC